MKILFEFRCGLMGLMLCVILSGVSLKNTHARPTEFLTLGVNYKAQPPDSLTGLGDLPRPFLLYSNFNTWDSGLRMNLLIAGLYNSLSLERDLGSKAYWRAGLSNLIWIGGDKPNIDNFSFDGAYDFDGYWIRSEAAVGTRTQVLKQNQRLEGFYLVEKHFHTPSSRQTGSIFFQGPSNFWVHGGGLQFLPDGAGRSELHARGFWPSLRVAAMQRLQHQSWGDTQNLRNSKHWFEFDGELKGAHSFNSYVSLHSVSSGAWVSKADRLSATRDGRKAGLTGSPFLGRVRADRSIQEELGIQVFLRPQRDLALRPFGFVAAYRELQPLATVKRWAKGGGVKMLGQGAQDRFVWEAAYGLVNGVDRSQRLTQEISAALRYRFTL